MRHRYYHNLATANVYAFFLLSACRRGSQPCIPQYPVGHVVPSTCPCAHIILQHDVAFLNFAFSATLSCKRDSTRAIFTFTLAFASLGIFLFSHRFQFCFRTRNGHLCNSHAFTFLFIVTDRICIDLSTSPGGIFLGVIGIDKWSRGIELGRKESEGVERRRSIIRSLEEARLNDNEMTESSLCDQIECSDGLARYFPYF